MKSSFESLGELHISEYEGNHELVGSCLIERRRKHLVQHSINDQPAKLYKHIETGEVFRREWYHQGVPSRLNGKASIIDESCEDTLSIWHEKGRIGRSHGPAKTWTAPNGIIVREEYWRLGEPVKRGVFAIERDRITGEEIGRVKVGLGKWNVGDPTPFLTPS